MNKTIGISGYLILIISGAYLDAPIIALLAMPLFLLGFILLLKFYLGFIASQISKRWLAKLMIVIGTILLCALLGYSVVEYNQFQVAVDRNNVETLFPSALIKIMLIVATNIIASILIYFGIKNSGKLNRTNLLLVLLPTLILIPVTLFLIKFTILTGFWFGG